MAVTGKKLFVITAGLFGWLGLPTQGIAHCVLDKTTFRVNCIHAHLTGDGGNVPDSGGGGIGGGDLLELDDLADQISPDSFMAQFEAVRGDRMAKPGLMNEIVETDWAQFELNNQTLEGFRTSLEQLNTAVERDRLKAEELRQTRQITMPEYRGFMQNYRRSIDNYKEGMDQYFKDRDRLAGSALIQEQ